MAGRALVDGWRADSARRQREAMVALDPADRAPASDRDDTLTLLFLCCHPALSPPSQLALTLRAVGGLHTAEVAAAFLVPEATIAKRISRAKDRIRAAGARFELPAEPDRGERLGVIRHVLYLMFNEGYTTSAGPALHRADLTTEAIRLTRLLHDLLPHDTETRRAARADAAHRRPPRRPHRRGRVDRAARRAGPRPLGSRSDRRGRALLTRTLGTGPVGQYQLQAAIAALHDEAPTAEQTDWPQILALRNTRRRAPGGITFAVPVTRCTRRQLRDCGVSKPSAYRFNEPMAVRRGDAVHLGMFCVP